MIEEITLPNTIQNIKGLSFVGCTSLSKIIYNGTVEEWNSIEKEENWINKNILIVCTNGDINL